MTDCSDTVKNSITIPLSKVSTSIYVNRYFTLKNNFPLTTSIQCCRAYQLMNTSESKSELNFCQHTYIDDVNRILECCRYRHFVWHEIETGFIDLNSVIPWNWEREKILLLVSIPKFDRMFSLWPCGGFYSMLLFQYFFCCGM